MREESKRVAEEEGMIKSCTPSFENGDKMLRKNFSPDRLWKSGSVWYKTQRIEPPNTLEASPRVIYAQCCDCTVHLRSFDLYPFQNTRKQSFKSQHTAPIDFSLWSTSSSKNIVQRWEVQWKTQCSCRSKKRLSDHLEHLIRAVCMFALTLLKSLDRICC